MRNIIAVLLAALLLVRAKAQAQMAPMVMPVKVDGKVALTPVMIGQRRPGQVEITSGLNASDRVVTDGQIKNRLRAAIISANVAPGYALGVVF